TPSSGASWWSRRSGCCPELASSRLEVSVAAQVQFYEVAGLMMGLFGIHGCIKDGVAEADTRECVLDAGTDLLIRTEDPIQPALMIVAKRDAQLALASGQTAREPGVQDRTGQHFVHGDRIGHRLLLSLAANGDDLDVDRWIRIQDPGLFGQWRPRVQTISTID